MKIPSFFIDGSEYTLPCSIQRTAEKRTSDNAGYLMDETYNNDVLGTYLTYSISLAIPKGSESEYSNLFDLLAAPISEYTFTMPYNQDYITFDGRIESITDTLFLKTDDDVNIWRSVSFNVVSNDPVLKELIE